MPRPNPSTPVLALALAVLAPLVPFTAPLTAEEAPRPGDDSANVLLTLTVADSTEDGVNSEHSVSALALDDRSARLVTGWRLPIPEAAGEGLPVTRWSYQDIGLSATLQGRILEGERVRVRGKVEVSAVDEATSVDAPAPRLDTFRHEFEVVLPDGVGTAVATVAKPHGGSLQLSISASIQE